MTINIDGYEVDFSQNKNAQGSGASIGTAYKDGIRYFYKQFKNPVFNNEEDIIHSDFIKNKAN